MSNDDRYRAARTARHFHHKAADYDPDRPNDGGRIAPTQAVEADGQLDTLPLLHFGILMTLLSLFATERTVLE